MIIGVHDEPEYAGLLSEMPEQGTISNKQAAALVGAPPFNRKSGSYKGQQRICGGRYKIRMAMMSAIQCNPIFKAKYEQLVSEGKPKNWLLLPA